jgi:hypothetical protein
MDRERRYFDSKPSAVSAVPIPVTRMPTGLGNFRVCASGGQVIGGQRLGEAGIGYM